MITSKNRVDRRTMLRGAGGVAIGLPFLSAMLKPGRSHAADTTPTRLVVFYSPGGTLIDKWRPTGTSTTFNFQNMMSPLTPMKDRLVVVDGLNLSITQIGSGHPHSKGMAGLLTGQQLLAGNFNTNGGNASFADGPSIDQVIADKISAGLRFKSLELSSGWSTGIASGGMPHPANIINFAGSQKPIPPATDPYGTFKRIFSDASSAAAQIAEQTWNNSILDAVSEQYNDLSKRLGSDDRAKLDAHLAMIQESQRGLNAAIKSGCQPPTTINPAPGFYEDGAAAEQDNDGGAFTGVKVPVKARAMVDLLVASLACDMTRVGTMQWGDSEAKFLLGFLNDAGGKPLVDHHHSYQHDKGFQPAALEVIYKWYAQNFLDLLQKMDAVVEGNGRSLLDNSLVLWGSEIQKPDSHAQDNMPFMLAGKAGGQLATGRWLQVKAQPHNNLLVSILNMFGLSQAKFGHPDYCTGALSGLA